MISTCVDKAIEIYLLRKEIDTNPLIVQMINPTTNRNIHHWYYRSDQFIFQPDDFFPFYRVRRYVGDSSKAPSDMYGAGTFKPDIELIKEAKKLARAGILLNNCKKLVKLAL